MIRYKHTQIGYFAIVTLILIIPLFFWIHITALAEPPSYDSGPNFLITFIMGLIVFILLSFSTLTVLVDHKNISIKFGWGIFKKVFSLNQIASVKSVRNKWYYGWGIRYWWWPRMTIYNVSGFDAVEIVMKNGKIYRIGTDESRKLENIISQEI